MFKLSFSTLSAPYYSIDEIIGMARANQYDGVELRFVSGRSDLVDLADFTHDRMDATREKFENARLAIPCVGTGILIENADHAQLDDLVAEARQYAALAQRLGSPLIRVFAGPPPGAEDADRRYPDIGSAVSRIAEAVEPFGVSLAIETHGTLSRAGDLAEVLSFADTANVSVIWDLMHTFRNGESLIETLDALGPRIRHVHLRDSAGMADDVHDSVEMGEGIAPTAEFLRLLDEHRFTGFISFEWEKFWFPELAEPEVVIPQFAAYMRALSS